MFIYNITIKVNNSILKQWMKWQMEEHVPQIMDTHLFSGYKIYRLLEQDDVGEITYIFQYHTDDIKNYQKYIDEHAPLLREKAISKWGDGFVAFRSLLQSVQ